MIARSLLLVALALLALAPAGGAQMPPIEESPNEGPALYQGDSWESEFPIVGSVRYHCHPHDNMTGVVRVSATHPDAKDRVDVRIENYSFSPQEVWVRPGGVVNWTNYDDDQGGVMWHNVMFIGFTEGDPNKPPETETPGPFTVPVTLALLGAIAIAARRARTR